MAFMSEHTRSECVSCQLETRYKAKEQLSGSVLSVNSRFHQDSGVSECHENSVFKCVGRVLGQECACMQDVGVCRVARLQCVVFRKQVDKLCVCMCSGRL